MITATHLERFEIDSRVFLASPEARESAEGWRKAFPEVYGNLPAKVAKSFAARDYRHAISDMKIHLAS